MRPKSRAEAATAGVIPGRFEQLIDLRHPLAVLVAYSGEVGQSRSEATLVFSYISYMAHMSQEKGK